MTSQEKDKRDEQGKISKSQVRFGNKTQLEDHSGQTGVAKTKIRRPASPYHISSMTVYQKDKGRGFTSCKNEAEKTLEEPAPDDSESVLSPSDLKAKWFLSTNQWQGFIPLQISGTDSLCYEEVSDIGKHPACTDDVTDSNEMSPTVSESLEKMKENHSLFYKIACDISISDTDITKNEGNSNDQMSPRSEEEEQQLVITESVQEEAPHNSGISSNQDSKDSSLHLPSHVDENSPTINKKLQGSTIETQDKVAIHFSASSGKGDCVHEKNTQKKHEDTVRKEDQLQKDGETIREAPVRETDCDHVLDENRETREEQSEAKESEDKKVDQKRPKEMEESSNLSEENKETVQERGNDPAITPSSSKYKGRSVIRSASFGKARVTVLRTSL